MTMLTVEQPVEPKEERKYSPLQSRAVKASQRFLEKRGYENLDLLNQDIIDKPVLTCFDNDDFVVVVIDVIEAQEHFTNDEDKYPRELVEALFIKAVADRSDEVGDCRIRMDIITMMIIGADRALIRHHISFQQSMND